MFVKLGVVPLWATVRFPVLSVSVPLFACCAPAAVSVAPAPAWWTEGVAYEGDD